MRTTPIEIAPDNPFANCKLNREQYANVLTSIVGAYDKGFVLAVNGKWGTGKTTFMDMWRQSLVNQGYKTIYFNAWENDFTSEPMVAILGELKSLTTTESSIFDNILEKSAKFSSTILPALAKTAATLAGFGGVADAIEKTSEAALSLINNEIEEYDKKKEALSEIKNDLAYFIKENCGDKPLVFIVDELDRCRPDYAVEVLEKIKHLFAVEGVVFVLSIDKEQLSHAICGYYGSEKIDSREYLRRFIDLEYNLPEPDYKQFISHLFKQYNFEVCLNKRVNDTGYIFSVLEYYCQKENYSLRQLEKIFNHAKVALYALGPNNNYRFGIVLFLITVKEFHSELYKKLISNDTDLRDMATYLDSKFYQILISKEQYRNKSQQFLYHLIYPILVLYANNRVGYLINFIDISNDKILDVEFPSAVKSGYFKKHNINQILGVNDATDFGQLSDYTNKIDLLENLKL